MQQPEKQNHHYIPQMYLRGFLDPAQAAKRQNVLWRYRPGEKPHPKGPKGVGAELMFYDAPEIGPDHNKTEDLLMEIENAAAPHMEKLRAGKIGLTRREKSELSTFIAISMTRTAFFRELSNTSAISLMKGKIRNVLGSPEALDKVLAELGAQGETVDAAKARGALRAVVDGQLAVSQDSKGWSIKIMCERALELDDYFERMRWSLLYAPEGETFITSDNPVHLLDSTASQRGPKGFAFSHAMQFYFPVSSHFTLVGDFVLGRDQHLTVDGDTVHKFNRNQMARARREVYASRKSNDLQAEFDEVVKPRPPLIPALPDEYLKSL